MSTKSQIENTIKKILALNNKIRFVAIISDTGKIISCQLNPDKHSLLTKSREEKFCRDIIKRKMMRQEFDNNLGKVIAAQASLVTQWLEKYGIPYDELIFGKPNVDYFIDDKGFSFKNWEHTQDFLLTQQKNKNV